MSEIKVIKFVSGECAVTELEDDGAANSDYTLKNPIIIMPTQEGLGMMPLNPFGKSDKIKISKQHVLFIDDPDDEIKNVYNAKFGSGIVTASGFNVLKR